MEQMIRTEEALKIKIGKNFSFSKWLNAIFDIVVMNLTAVMCLQWRNWCFVWKIEVKRF